jgi:hypothetical protein
MNDYSAIKKEIPDSKATAIKRRLAKGKGKPGNFDGPGDGVHTKKTKNSVANKDQDDKND